jgi:hypothetical protein
MNRAIGAHDGCDGTEPAVLLWPGMFHGSQILGSLAIGTAACAWALRRGARPRGRGAGGGPPAGGATTSSAATARGRSSQPGGCWSRPSCRSSF